VHIREVRLLEFRVSADGVSGVRFRGKRALEEKTDKSIEVKKRRVRASGFSEHEVERREEDGKNQIKIWVVMDMDMIMVMRSVSVGCR
jgi:hypothetical protein